MAHWIQHKDSYGQLYSVHMSDTCGSCQWCRECPPIAQPNPEAVNYMYGGPQPTFKSSCLALEVAWLALVGEVLGAVSNALHALNNWRGVVRK